jgi:hypothetical protein
MKTMFTRPKPAASREFRIVLDSASADSVQAQSNGHRVLWNVTLPFTVRQPRLFLEAFMYVSGSGGATPSLALLRLRGFNHPTSWGSDSKGSTDVIGTVAIIPNTSGGIYNASQGPTCALRLPTDLAGTIPMELDVTELNPNPYLTTLSRVTMTLVLVEDLEEE